MWNFETGNLVKTFEVTEMPVRCGRFIQRKNWVVTGSVRSRGDCTVLFLFCQCLCLSLCLAACLVSVCVLLGTPLFLYRPVFICPFLSLSLSLFLSYWSSLSLPLSPIVCLSWSTSMFVCVISLSLYLSLCAPLPELDIVSMFPSRFSVSLFCGH